MQSTTTTQHQPTKERKDAAQILSLQTQNEYTKSCRCEHDCCGHYCGGVEWSSLRKAGRSGRKWDFRTSYSPNV